MVIEVGPIFVKKKHVCFDFREHKTVFLDKKLRPRRMFPISIQSQVTTYLDFLFSKHKLRPNSKEHVSNQCFISGDHIFSRFYKRNMIIYSAQKYQPPAGYV